AGARRRGHGPVGRTLLPRLSGGLPHLDAVFLPQDAFQVGQGVPNALGELLVLRHPVVRAVPREDLVVTLLPQPFRALVEPLPEITADGPLGFCLAGHALPSSVKELGWDLEICVIL